MKSAIGKWFATRTRVSVSPGVAPVRYRLTHLDRYRKTLLLTLRCSHFAAQNGSPSPDISPQQFGMSARKDLSNLRLTAEAWSKTRSDGYE